MRLSVGILLVAAILAAGCSRPSASTVLDDPPRPPIVLIVVDALRADRLGCYGYHRPTSPHTDRFAEESVLFEMALSNSSSSAPSFTSLFTSLSPPVHGVGNLSTAVRLYPPLPDSIPLLAEILSENGYLTVGLHGGGNIPGDRGFDRGFEHYEPVFHHWKRHQGATLEALGEISDMIRRWGEEGRHRGKPLFLFIHHLVCHDPYLFGPPESRFRFLEDPAPGLPLSIEELRREGDNLAAAFWRNIRLNDPRHRAHIGDLYDGGVYHSDYVFRDLMEVLKEEGIYDKALIILTSDHGEGLGEHGSRGHGPLWREHLHVPLLLRFPGEKFAGRRIAEPVGLMDIPPTLYEYLQLDIGHPLQGISLLPLLDRTEQARPRPVASYQEAESNPYFHLGAIRITQKNYVYIHRLYRAGSLLEGYLAEQESRSPCVPPSISDEETAALDGLVARGDWYFERDSFGEARKLYQRARDAAPDDGRVLLKLASALREEQRYEEAAEIIRERMAREPDNYLVYREMVWILTDQAHYQKAEAALSRAAELFPEDPRVWLDWGNLLRRQQLRDKAKEKMLKALRLSGDDSPINRKLMFFFRWLGGSETAAGVLKERFREGTGCPPLVSILGEFYLREGRLDEARMLYDNAIREKPDRVWPYLARADLHHTVRETDQVEEMLETALKFFLDRPGLLIVAGRKHLEMEDPARAAELLARAVELEPEEGFTRLLLGSALRQTGRMEEAEEALRKAEFLLGEDEKVNLELGKIYLSQWLEEKAAEAFSRATSDWPGSHDLYDVNYDPREKINLFLELPPVAGRMMEEERRLREEDRALREYYFEGEKLPPSFQLEEERERELREQLKILGY